MTMAGTKRPGDNVDVEIFGATYTLRGGADPETIRSLAIDLDGRMRELASPASAADPLKVAVLAALRLSDELRAAREEAARREAETAARIDACADRLDRAFGGARA